MKDNFSTQSAEYARFRPGYPAELIDLLLSHTPARSCAWDCATGNGQIALQLAPHFQRIEATDISENQLRNALQHPRVHYSLQAAEIPDFPDHCFDLVVVGQAAHWFDFERFYAQLRRVARPGATLALVGYNLLRIDPTVDALIDRLYTETLGKYWDAERRHVDHNYTTLTFPFNELPWPEMAMHYRWTRDHLLGYLGTWSAMQHFTKANNRSPLSDAFMTELNAVWPDGVEKSVRFPIFGRLGIVEGDSIQLTIYN